MQRSVFEVVCSEVGHVRIKGELATMIDSELDSIRVYRLSKASLDDVMELVASSAADSEQRQHGQLAQERQQIERADGPGRV